MPWVIAHRGASAECPENTLAAFDRGVALGADGLELDLQLTADGAIVVYHDRTLAKVGHGRGRIADHDAAWLTGLDVGTWKDPRFAGERMPTLDAVLRRYARRTRLLLELKVEPDDSPRRRHALVDRTLDALAKHRVAGRVYVLSFDAALLARARRRLPSLRTVLDVGRPPAPNRLRATLRDIDVLCPPARFVTARLGAAVRDLGRQLWVYRCDTPSSVRLARRAQVTAAMSDRPGWLRAHWLAPR
jgi:glycerophosphoryl diester phosphodiesterase